MAQDRERAHCSTPQSYFVGQEKFFLNNTRVTSDRLKPSSISKGEKWMRRAELGVLLAQWLWLRRSSLGQWLLCRRSEISTLFFSPWWSREQPNTNTPLSMQCWSHLGLVWTSVLPLAMQFRTCCWMSLSLGMLRLKSQTQCLLDKDI